MLGKINKILIVICLLISLGLTGYIAILLSNGSTVQLGYNDPNLIPAPTPTLFIPTVSYQDYNEMRKMVEDNDGQLSLYTEDITDLKTTQDQQGLLVGSLERDVATLETNLDEQGVSISVLQEQAKQSPSSIMKGLSELDQQFRERLIIITLIIGSLILLGALMWYSAMVDIRSKTKRIQSVLTQASTQHIEQELNKRPAPQPVIQVVQPPMQQQVQPVPIAQPNMQEISALIHRAVQDAMQLRFEQINRTIQVNLLSSDLNEANAKRLRELQSLLVQSGFQNTRMIDQLDERALNGTTIIPFLGAMEDTQPVKSLYQEFCLAHRERLQRQQPNLILYTPDGAIEPEVSQLYPNSTLSDTPVATINSILAHAHAISYQSAEPPVAQREKPENIIVEDELEIEPFETEQMEQPEEDV